jgi:hypothetical protein
MIMADHDIDRVLVHWPHLSAGTLAAIMWLRETGTPLPDELVPATLPLPGVRADRRSRRPGRPSRRPPLRHGELTMPLDVNDAKNIL